jgi:hypothetical protein
MQNDSCFEMELLTIPGTGSVKAFAGALGVCRVSRLLLRNTMHRTFVERRRVLAPCKGILVERPDANQTKKC